MNPKNAKNTKTKNTSKIKMQGSQMQPLTLKIIISLLGIVAIIVLCIAFTKARNSQHIRIEKMTENIASLRKMRNGKSGYAETDYLSTDKNMQEKYMWGGGKSGGREH